MTTRHYSLEDAAEMICQGAVQNPRLWVLKRIRSGEFKALRVGRYLRLTDKQIEDAIASLEISHRPEPQQRQGITELSRRRRASA